MATWVNLMDVVYPVGSVYISFTSTSPSTMIGGTWVQVTNKYLYATTNTGTGGSSSVSHAHNSGNYVAAINPQAGGGNYSYYRTVATSWQAQWWTNATGLGADSSTRLEGVPIIGASASASVSIQPSYQGVFVWHRTA